MNFDEQIAALTSMSEIVALIVDSDDVMPPQDRVDVWVIADGVIDEARVMLRQLYHDAVVAIAELGVPNQHLYHGAFGTVLRTRRRQGAERWRGYQLCDALAEEMIDANGERVRAVPVHVMRDTVAGCADDSLVSSKWRLTGLRGRVLVDKYRDGEPVYVDAVEIVRGM